MEIKNFDLVLEEIPEVVIEEPPKKYIPKEPPLLESKYSKFIEDLKIQLAAADSLIPKEELKSFFDDGEEEYDHAWIYLQINETGFFIESTTGQRKQLDDANYLSINCMWNHDNYWVNKESLPANNRDVDKFSNPENWIQFLPNANETDLEAPFKLMRPFSVWMYDLEIPLDSYDLMYRLGQKSEIFNKVHVEYYAPYLLKEGIVQKAHFFEKPISRDNFDKRNAIRILETFRFRADKMFSRETFKDQNKVIECFAVGRDDLLKTHEHVRLSGSSPIEYLSTFYHQYRVDGLETREVKDMQIIENYVGRLDGLESMKAYFTMGEKKFGPADGNRGINKEVTKIIQTFVDLDKPKEKPFKYGVDELNEIKDYFEELEEEEVSENGRVLNTDRILQRTFDIENERIIIRFHRELGQIFCKTIEFNAPPDPSIVEDFTEDDYKIYMVDPRNTKPCIVEMWHIYNEQIAIQEETIQQVFAIQQDMDKLLEKRMKELSSNEMDVWRYDVKRNTKVQKGRIAQEKAKEEREKNMMDLELDILAPYLERHENIESLTKHQAIEIQNECLENVRKQLEEKEKELEEKLISLKDDLEKNKSTMAFDEINSKKFFINVLETRYNRQKDHSKQYFEKAEKKISKDSRLLKFIKEKL